MLTTLAYCAKCLQTFHCIFSTSLVRKCDCFHNCAVTYFFSGLPLLINCDHLLLLHKCYFSMTGSSTHQDSIVTFEWDLLLYSFCHFIISKPLVCLLTILNHKHIKCYYDMILESKKSSWLFLSTDASCNASVWALWLLFKTRWTICSFYLDWHTYASSCSTEVHKLRS